MFRFPPAPEPRKPSFNADEQILKRGDVARRSRNQIVLLVVLLLVLGFVSRFEDENDDEDEEE